MEKNITVIQEVFRLADSALSKNISVESKKIIQLEKELIVRKERLKTPRGNNASSTRARIYSTLSTYAINNGRNGWNIRAIENL